MPELIVILAVALIVLGPKRLPEIARGLGKTIAEFRRATSGISEELENARVMLEEETRKIDEDARRLAARPAAPSTGAPEPRSPSAAVSDSEAPAPDESPPKTSS